MSSPSRPPPPSRRSRPSSLLPLPSPRRDRATSPPSPLTRRLSLATHTVEALAEGLGRLKEVGREREGVEGRCCCEAEAGRTGEILPVGEGCEARVNQLRLEEDLAIAGEIGQALLQRYEALQAKFESTCTQCDEQAELLATSYTHSANLEKANDLSLRRYAELVRKNEGLEKRLTQMHQTQQLSSSTILTLRTELSHLRTLRTLSLPLPPSSSPPLSSSTHSLLTSELTNAHSRIKELEEEREEMRVELQLGRGALGEAERAREGERRRREGVERELEELKKGQIGSPDPNAPEIQQTLTGLLSQSIIDKHTIHTLRTSVSHLSSEIDVLRSSLGVAPRTPGHQEMETLGEAEKEKGEGREEQRRKRRSYYPTSLGQSGRRESWAQTSLGGTSTTSTDPSSGNHNRRSSFFPPSSTGHGRNISLTPSWTSSGVAGSPRSAFGQLREEDGRRERESTVRPGTGEVGSPTGEHYQKERNGSGGLRYSVNGVVLKKISAGSGGGGGEKRRSWSVDRAGVVERPRVGERSFSGVGSIAETAPPLPFSPDERPTSPLNETRPHPPKRLSYSRHPLRPLELRLPHSPTLIEEGTRSEGGDVVGSPGTGAEDSERRVLSGGRRRLMLGRSEKGVQTDLEEFVGTEVVPDPSVMGIGALGYDAMSVSTSVQSTAVLSQGTFPTSDSAITTTDLDARSGALLLVIEHMNKMLLKLRAADVPTLTRRLRKQHLPGSSADVGHLSATTMKALGGEVEGLRSLFRGVLEKEREGRRIGEKGVGVGESAVTRKDLMLLLKLFREVFGELVELRGVVNTVILDPAQAVKMKEDAMRDDVEDEGEVGRGRGKTAKPGQGAVGGLGWMVAPISRFFVTAPALSDSDTEGPARKDRIPSGMRSAPKQGALTGATTTNVSVGFVGTGASKRAVTTSAVPQEETLVDGLPPSPTDDLTGLPTRRTGAPAVAVGIPTRSSAPLLNSSTSTGEGTIRPSPLRRDGLLGIFAGAPASVSNGGNWVVIDGRQVQAPRLRATSSQHFGTQRVGGGHRRMISRVVDGVIDQPLPAEEYGERGEEDFRTVISGRKMRPRGLSDSSIRTTYQSYAETDVVPVKIQQVLGRQGPMAMGREEKGSVQRSGSVLGRFGRTLQGFAGARLVPMTAPMTTDEGENEGEGVKGKPEEPQPVETTTPEPIPSTQAKPQPIPIIASPSTARSVSGHRASGLLNMFIPSSAAEASALQAMYEEAGVEGGGGGGGGLGGSLVERRGGRGGVGMGTYGSHV